MKKLINNVLDNLDQDKYSRSTISLGIPWYEIRKFSTHFSKGKTRNKKTERTCLENKLKTLENSPSFVDNPEYIETNERLDKIYQGKTTCIRIRSKCNWSEHREKCSKLFSKFRKILGSILIDNIEINYQKDINTELYLYYKNLYNER